MKTAHDPRHLARVDRVKALYTYSFAGVSEESIDAIVASLAAIDASIGQYATERAVSEIAKIDLAILRQGVFELQQGEKPSIVIDEAVEIAKSFGTDNAPKFVHAILSQVAKSV